MMMPYLDANVFVFATLYSGKKAGKALEMLESISIGNVSAITSSLTIDEVAWAIIQRTHKRTSAINACKTIMMIPNLKILDVRSQDVLKALWFMEKYPHLEPRDAIHVAVCFHAKSRIIISNDSDFDNIDEITWEKLE